MYFRHVLAHWALQKLSKAAVLSNYPNVLKLKEVCNGGVGCSLLKLAADKPRPLLQNSLPLGPLDAEVAEEFLNVI